MISNIVVEDILLEDNKIPQINKFVFQNGAEYQHDLIEIYYKISSE